MRETASERLHELLLGKAGAHALIEVGVARSSGHGISAWIARSTAGKASEFGATTSKCADAGTTSNSAEPPDARFFSTNVWLCATCTVGSFAPWTMRTGVAIGM